jgi:hypothetical protein
MRGHTHCRAHLDAELGPRGAGAPKGNLNALKHGRHAHPLPPPDLDHLASHLVDHPDDLPYQIGLAAQALQDQANGDPFKTLIALRTLVIQLVRAVATLLLASELESALNQLPPRARAEIQHAIHTSIPRGNPERKILLLRKLRKTITGTKQLPEPEHP